ncbi:unnamed protein product, partial [Effrenium voratum]
RDHALVAFREGAAAVLLPLLSPRTGGEVLQNALGATSSLLMAGQAAQDALGANGAVAALCGLLDSPAAEQAAAALGNLLSGHAENGRRAEASRALPRLLQLLRLAATEQRSKLAENCCAALANLVAGTHTAQA